MKKYGYLKGNLSQGSSEALHAEQDVVYGIVRMQRFAGLPETGTLDPETLKLMKSPRCGNKDVASSQRQKRYVIGADGWTKQNLTYQ